MKRTTLLIAILFVVSHFGYGQLIINHQHTNITTLTEQEINQAKQTLHIVYGHTSHGSQLIDGMNGLIGFANGGGKGMSFPEDIFAFNYDGWDGALDLRNGDGLPDDVGYYPAWYNASRSYLEEANNLSRNVMMWSWCGQVDDKYAAGTLYSEYILPMSQLEADYPNVKFVYMTGHLDHGDEANNKAANDSIRRYCQRNKKILYDFADIESYNPDGTFFEFASDDCSYYNSNGDYLGNWATEWRANHTENTDWYDCYAAHSDALNGNQKAYAAWRLFAEIAKIIQAESIPANLPLSDTIIGNGEIACFNAYDTITVAGIGTVEIQSNASAELIAGKCIRFMPGFHAQSGSYVDAHITTTGDFCEQAEASSQYVVTQKQATIEESVPEDFGKTADKTVKVYPNPNNGTFHLVLSNFSSNANIAIFDMQGKVIFHQAGIDNNLMDINLPTARKGMYTLRAIDGKTVKTTKMMIR